MKREQMMHFNKPAAMLSIAGVEIEVTNFAREASRLAKYRLPLPPHQFAVTLAYAVHSSK
jgi:hypothetical protein